MADVAIVGAGPVGMSLALFLSRHGITSTLIERGPARPCVGSRSICVAHWTLEALDRVGCGAQMAAEGTSWTLGRTYFRERELFQTTFPLSGQERFPPFVNLGQQRVEEILLERVLADERIDLLSGHEVTDVRQAGGAVTLAVRAPDGSEKRLTASYAAACDGSGSPVRQMLGIPFPGVSHRDRFLIVDLRAKLDFARERRLYFDHPRNPGRQVLIHPQPDDVWRIDWQVPDTFDLDRERRSGRLDQRIRDLIGHEAEYEVLWESLYRFEQRRAERFRHGRVFLVGDAAHVFSPFGARGMNSGIQDAENLAWKLWLVVAGFAADRLLDTYADERQAAAEHNLAVTSATMRFLAPPTTTRRLARNWLLSGSAHWPALKRFVDSGRLSEPFAYAGSPIVDGGGAIVPDVRWRDGDGVSRRLRDALGHRFVALRFAASRPPDSSPIVEELTVGGPRSDLLRALGADDGDLILIRPDGHVAAHHHDSSGTSLETALARAIAL